MRDKREMEQNFLSRGGQKSNFMFLTSKPAVAGKMDFFFL